MKERLKRLVHDVGSHLVRRRNLPCLLPDARPLASTKAVIALTMLELQSGVRSHKVLPLLRAVTGSNRA